jgi:hypothetical protein
MLKNMDLGERLILDYRERGGDNIESRVEDGFSML